MTLAWGTGLAQFTTASNTWELQNPQTSSGGGITGPGSTTVNNIPQWNSTTGAALKAGLPLTTAAVASSVVETNGSGDIGAGVNTARPMHADGGIDTFAAMLYGTRFGDNLTPETDTCTSSAATISGTESTVYVLLNNQTTCAITLGGGTASITHYFIFLVQGSSPSSSISYVSGKIIGGPTSGGTANQVTYMQCTMEAVTGGIMYCVATGWSSAVAATGSITIAGTSVALGGSTTSLPSPGAIGGTTPSTGAFTTLTATSLATGTSPPSVTAGTGGVNALGEGTVPSVGAASGVDVVYADSTQHGLLSSFNNGSYLPLVQGPASDTSGHIASYSGTNGGKLVDSGVVAANTVVASSPGAGIAHFAGSTQTVTSSAVSLTADVTGVLPQANISAVGLPTPGATCTFTANSTYCVCTTTCTITVPAPAAGYQFCAANDDNVSTVITMSAIGSSARYENTARTAYGTAGTGTFVSGGAVGDFACLLGRDSTHYLTLSSKGTWTAN